MLQTSIAVFPKMDAERARKFISLFLRMEGRNAPAKPSPEGAADITAQGASPG